MELFCFNVKRDRSVDDKWLEDWDAKLENDLLSESESKPASVSETATENVFLYFFKVHKYKKKSLEARWRCFYSDCTTLGPYNPDRLRLAIDDVTAEASAYFSSLLIINLCFSGSPTWLYYVDERLILETKSAFYQWTVMTKSCMQEMDSNEGRITGCDL